MAIFLSISAWAKDESKSDAEDTRTQAKEVTADSSDVRKELTIGVYSLSEDAFRYGKYSGLTDSGAYAMFNFKLEKRPDPKSSDTTRWRFQGWRVGLDSRRIEFDYNQQGTQRFKVDYREIPNNRFNDGLTPFRRQSPGVWELAPAWNIDPNNSTTRGFRNLEENLVGLSIDTKRRRLELAYDRKLGSKWKLDLDYRHETKQGQRTFGSTFGYNFVNVRGVILPAPVDYTTDTLEAMFGYGASRAQINFGIYASFFSNSKNTLVFQNPYAHQSQWADAVKYPDSQGRSALEPDNSYLQFRVNGGLYFGSATRLVADFSVGTMKQNDLLLPYTVNPDLVINTPVPLQKTDARINTTMFNLRLTSKLARRLGLAVNYRYNDRDNKTPQAVFPYIGADSQDQRAFESGRINLPYSYRKQKADAILTYRFAKAARLKASFEYTDYNRDFMEVENSNELAWQAGFTYRGWSMASVKFDYRNSRRNVSEYIGNVPLLVSTVPGSIEDNDFQNHPLLRKYFLTDRDRNEYRFRADFFPDARINIGFAANYQKDNYAVGYFGLNNARIKGWSLDAGWYPAKNIVLTGFYTNEKYDSSQSSRYFFSETSVTNPDNDWFADTTDRVDTYNIALRFNEIGADRGWKGVELGLDYTYSNTASVIDVFAVTRDTQPLPDLLSKLQAFSIWGNFAVSGRSSIRLTAESSRLKTEDWGLDGVVTDTLPQVLLLGQRAANYKLWLISTSWSYRF